MHINTQQTRSGNYLCVNVGVVCLLCSQYEQLTLMKSDFETKTQRQHELSDVRGFTHHTMIDNRFLNMTLLYGRFW